MPSERLILRFPDGQSESRNPPVDLSVGDRLTRRLRDWIVASVDAHDPEVTVVVLRGARLLWRMSSRSFRASLCERAEPDQKALTQPSSWASPMSNPSGPRM